jgi:beta-carotene 3-hydroxylase
MNIVLVILIIAGTFLFMEGVAWFAHKYIMHGFLWNLHADHHHRENHDDFLEQNDWFFVIFAVPGIALFIIGASVGLHAPWFWMGAGITLYGACYFFVHDLFIHQRIKVLRNTNNTYLKAIRKAHKVHHKHLQKEDGECFGMLWVPIQYFKEARKAAQRSRATT